MGVTVNVDANNNGEGMIEVYQDGNGWRWRFICAIGRELMGSAYAYPSQEKAITVAKALRAKFFSSTSLIDHRQGAAI